MSMNIKNERVHDLAREAAKRTGKSVTGTVEEALVLLLRSYGADPEQAQAQRKIELAWAIAAEYSADPGMGHREIATVEDLYDETAGLPR